MKHAKIKIVLYMVTLVDSTPEKFANIWQIDKVE